MNATPPDPDDNDTAYAVFAGVLILGGWIVSLLVIGGIKLALGAFR